MEDEKIVNLYWERDPNAIKHTEKKYGRYCTSIAFNILGNAQDAEECVSDTWLSAWNAMPIHRPKRLAAFLGKITRNHAFNRYRQNHAGKRGGNEIPAILDELSECLPTACSVEQETEYKELLQTINSFLETLPPKRRSIFVCRYWYSDSIGNIARQHGMRENSVSMTLCRIRAKLQDYLKERGFMV